MHLIMICKSILSIKDRENVNGTFILSLMHHDSLTCRRDHTCSAILLLHYRVLRAGNGCSLSANKDIQGQGHVFSP